MTLSPRLRKLTLFAHLTSSVGWLGAVAAFLGLAVAGATSPDAQMLRAVDRSMELIAWYVIVPLCFVSLLTGLALSLGTAWGLLRHYWVVVKLLITPPATLILLVHMRPIGFLAGAASRPVPTTSGKDLQGLQNLLMTAAGVALLALLVITTLSVYKPRGMTSYGWRKRGEYSDPSLP